jgi:ribosomal protein S18 acetylase RimI-like enzyme
MITSVIGTNVRDYGGSDEASWLRCRVLGFLDTAYFDDVWRVHPESSPGLSLVGALGDEIVGICEASPASHGATIGTVVVHPDHRRTGLGSVLIGELVRRLKQRGVRQLDAWTRDDPGTLSWYQACGFEVDYRYLHVFADGAAEMDSAATVSSRLIPRFGFFHADTQDAAVEADLRQRFSRVHACHRFVQDL